MNLQALAGNAPLKRQLDLQTARRGLSHAYILSGPAGVGKHTLAGLLAAALVCSGGGETPCGHCPGCRKARERIHPDIQWVRGEGVKGISVAQIRALRADAYIRPNEAPRKVYIVEDGQNMNPSAQNALLKLLEDGPSYAAFLLLTDNAGALLPTVRSRCEVLSLSPVTMEEAAAFLRLRFPQRPREELEEAARRCEGILGRAVRLLEEDGEARDALRQTALRLGQALAAGDELTLAELCVGLEKWDREALTALLDEEILLLRDALVRPGGSWDEPDPERRDTALALARGRAPARLLQDIALLDRLRAACGFYVGGGHLAGWLCAGLSGGL
ncbi:DNA polymerase III subunit delta' [Pseudoflavonifractor phocaeensis]|uniref:DNA polymerase III subunit delta' n=1 Tax=Pseudoflavonifractor phocaeensis TaxID=1870988 RepID=UPI00195AB17F|nr:DNA polymerase III subunit delta' [Pseudoflavonifractor phocaeensis]MBM6871326.1 DNA polymerase III subunit delta [Pseudoflavonifractor phocaeensis]